MLCLEFPGPGSGEPWATCIDKVAVTQTCAWPPCLLPSYSSSGLGTRPGLGKGKGFHSRLSGLFWSCLDPWPGGVWRNIYTVADTRNPRVYSLLFQGNEGGEVRVRLSAEAEEEARWVGVNSAPMAWDGEPP